MATTDVANAAVTDMTNRVTDFSVASYITDAATGAKETEYINTNYPKQLGYYKQIPELQKSINALATWILGKGWTADNRTTALLENIRGWGEDTFNTIMWGLLVTKKIGGDAFAEIIRNPKTGTIINIKPLDAGGIKVIVDEKGFIKRYEQINKITKKAVQIFQPNEILHLCNDRVADEIHGTSVIDACEAVILARNEAMADWRKVLHRNIVPVRIIEVDSDNTTKIAALKKQYEDVINKGEVLIIPKGNVSITTESPPLQDSLSTIKYYENFFYQAVGIPKIILGGSEEFTEASSKIGYLTFEQLYSREQVELEADLWNQLAIRIKFKKPASLQNELLSDEKKDKEQGAFKPNDLIAGRGE